MTSKYQILLDVWNAQKEFGRWKTHRKITPDIKKSVDENMLDGWDIEDMSGAIVNFAACYHSKETKWTFGKWGLAQFLSRGKREDDKRWIWFTANNYREDEWLTKEAIRDRIKQRHLVEQGEEIIEDCRRKPYAEMDEKELEVAYREGNTIVKHVISKIRQEKA